MQNKMFSKSKKGVSPLIATVLLIAFAVALGAVVMNWGKTYVEDQADRVGKRSDSQITCSMDVQLNWYKRNNIDQVCYGSNYVFFTIDNKGNIDVEDLKLIVDGETDIFVNESLINETFKKAYIKRFNITYDNSTYGAIQQVRIVPTVNIKGDILVCSDRVLYKDDPTLC